MGFFSRNVIGFRAANKGATQAHGDAAHFLLAAFAPKKKENLHTSGTFSVWARTLPPNRGAISDAFNVAE
jgi:hypothetical protein